VASGGNADPLPLSLMGVPIDVNSPPKPTLKMPAQTFYDEVAGNEPNL